MSARAGVAQASHTMSRILNRESWMEDALCAQIGGDIWHPEKGGSTKEAKTVCRECPVAAECLKYALDNDERFGIWGGFSERERRRLKRGEVVKPHSGARGGERWNGLETAS